MSEVNYEFRDELIHVGGEHDVIRAYARQFNLDTLIETGTYHGNTVAAMKEHFSEIYSIELGEDLFKECQQRFAGDPRIHLYRGNSGDVLRELLPTLTGKHLLFWLDAHFSGGDTVVLPSGLYSPIMQELDTIFALRPNSVVLIDDARDFIGRDGYPTLPELRTYVAAKVPNWVFEVVGDVIRLHEKQVGG